MPLHIPPGRIFKVPLAKPAEREQILSNFLTRVAKLYVKKTKDDMIQGPHTGTLYRKSSGFGFRRFHQASRKGEHPSPDTMNLVNSVKDQKLSATSHEAFVDDQRAPYGKFLERPRLDRKIMSQSDLSNFEQTTMAAERAKAQAELEKEV